MANHITVRLHQAILLACSLATLCTSCESYDFSDETAEEASSTTTVRILTRAATPEDDIYPLDIFAFAPDGSLRTSQRVESASGKVSLQLPQGEASRVVAVTADGETYSVPSSPSLTDRIELKAPQVPEDFSSGTICIAKDYAASHPLQMAQADLTPTSSSATLNLQMYYQMASLQFTLSGLPSTCSSVYVSVGSTYEGVSFGGDLSGKQNPVIPLVREAGGDRWTSGKVYVFPSSGNQTSFTINYDKNGEGMYAQVTYQKPLLAGIPYVLEGALEDGQFRVTGNVTPAQWGTPESLSFTFSPDVVTLIGGNSDTPEQSVGDIPAAHTLWEGHFVAAVTPLDETTADLLLLSVADFGGMTSALHATTPHMASEAAQNYREAALASWRIPTEDEARLLREQYLLASAHWNDVLASAEGDTIVLTDEKGGNVRYLCQDGQRTYSYKPGSSYNAVKDAGASIKDYHLRLVTTVRVREKVEEK